MRLLSDRAHSRTKERYLLHSHYTRFVSNLNLRRPLIHNNYGALLLHSHYTRFVSNLNLRRPLIHNNYGALLLHSHYTRFVSNLNLRRPLIHNNYGALLLHSHYTRFVSNLNLRRPLIHNNYGASTFTFIASKIWETIPLYLKKLYYYPFSKQYKLYLLNSQSVP